MIGRIVNLAEIGLLHQQRLEAHDAMIYDRRKGSYRIDGKGKLILFERPSAVPAPAKGPKPALQRTEISFSNGMIARLGTGNEADTIAHEAEFFGATVIWTGVAETTTKADPDVHTSHESYLTADNLKFSSEPRDPAAHSAQPRSHCIKAFGNVRLSGGDTSIQSDEAFFLFREEKIYARGEPARRVIIARKPSHGQPNSFTEAKAIQLDLKTGKAMFIDREATKFLDEKFAPSEQPRTIPDP